MNNKGLNEIKKVLAPTDYTGYKQNGTSELSSIDRIPADIRAAMEERKIALLRKKVGLPTINTKFERVNA